MRVQAIRLDGRAALSIEVTPESRYTSTEVAEECILPDLGGLDVEEQALLTRRQAGDTLPDASHALGWDGKRTERVRARLLRKLKGNRTQQIESRGTTQNTTEPAIRGGGSSLHLRYFERLSSGRRVHALSILTETFLQVMLAERLQPVETKYDKNVFKNISAKRLEDAFLGTSSRETKIMFNHPFAPKALTMPPAVEQPKTPPRKKTAESKPRHTEITSAIEQAISAADGREYFKEQQKLDTLRGRRDEIQARLGALIHAAMPEDDVNLRISDALAGQIRSEDRLGAIRTADIRLREIDALVEHQAVIVKRAEATYHRQVAELLRPTHEAIVGRIAAKLRALAIELEAEEDLFNELLNKRGLRQGSLRRMGVPAELLGDGLTAWIREAAGAGYSAAVQ